MNPVIFKRWSNKKWAILASMHKAIIIATLSFSYNILASGQEADRGDTVTHSKTLELEEVDITGDAPGDLDLMMLAPVQQLSQKDLQAGPALAAGEILDNSSRIDVRQRGMHGTQADLSIQGGSFDQSMVLLNGFDISDPQTGHFNLNLPLDPQAMESAELRSGAASRKLGIRAFSGALNIITDPADSSYLGGGALYGQNALYKGWLKANLAKKNVRTMATLSASGSEGYRDNTDFHSYSAFLHSKAILDHWSFEGMAGYNARNFGANAFYSARFERQYEETSTFFTALRSQWARGSLQVRGEFWMRLMSDHFLLDRENPDFYQNDHLNSVIGGRISLRYHSPLGVSSTGIQLRQDRILSSSLGEPDEQRVHPFRDDARALDHSYGRTGISWMLNHIWSHRGFSVDAGLLIDLADLGDPGNTDQAAGGPGNPIMLPGLDLRYRTGELDLHAGLNRSFRLPTFTDLFYSSPSHMGNPELKPEKAWNLETGLGLQKESFVLGLDGYYRMGRDMIDWILLMEDELWHTVNLGEVNALGTNLLLGWQAAASSLRKLSLRELSLQYSYTRLTRVSGEYISQYLLDYLKHKLTCSLRLQLPLDLEWKLQARYQDRAGSFSQWDPASGSYTETDYRAFVVVDSRLDYRFRHLGCFIQVSNLLDTPYQDIGNLPQPGRWASVGVYFN